MLEVLEPSPARVALARLVNDWQAPHVGALAGIAIKAAEDLGRLERRRIWRDPGQLIDDPNVAALACFARQRSGRVRLVGRSRRLQIIATKLERIRDLEQQRRQIEDLNEPGPALDPQWLRDFMGSRGD